MSTYELNGVRIVELPTEGPELRSGRDAVEIIGLASEHSAALIVIPAQRLGEGFFDLRSGSAGEIMQKFVTYQRRVAILGDISDSIAKSRSLAALVAESNRGRDLWFVASLDELARRLSDGEN